MTEILVKLSQKLPEILRKTIKSKLWVKCSALRRGSSFENANTYITCDINGIFRSDAAIWNNVHGLGANIPGIPWYTLPVTTIAGNQIPARALVPKVFKTFGIITGFIICDDAYWCEFEGMF